MAGNTIAADSGYPVLVVEDDDSTRVLLAGEIADAGHPVRVIADGRAAEGGARFRLILSAGGSSGQGSSR